MNNNTYEELRHYLENAPLVDCHDHSVINSPKYQDPFQVIINGYFIGDVIRTSSSQILSYLHDFREPIEKRWAVFEPIWQQTKYTGYGRVTQLVLDKFYGVKDLSLKSLHQIKDNLLDLTDETNVIKILDDAKIVARLIDIYAWGDQLDFLNGKKRLTPRSYPVFSLAHFHSIKTCSDIEKIFPDQTFTCIDEYLQAIQRVFVLYKNFGAVAVKDNSAYTRPLDYRRSTKAQAEVIFNHIIQDPRYHAAYPDETKPLDNYLFHNLIEFSRSLDLPVQLHTGQVALWDDIRRANASHLTPFVETYRDVRFDLLHGNYPYLGEYLYLAKNYPNVTLNYCWTNIINPLYSRQAYRQTISTVPHGKIHGYGSDFVGMTDRAWAHALITRDNIARALTDLVDIDYIDLEDAKHISLCWLYENPKNNFNLQIK